MTVLARTAALAAAGVLLAGCGSTAVEAPIPEPSRDLKAGAVPASSPAPVEEPSRWLDVTGQGVERQRDSLDRAQFASTPQPGVQVLHAVNAEGDLKICTITAVVGRGSTGQTGYVTAGHCGIGPYAAEQYIQTSRAGAPELLGVVTGAEDDDAGVDSAVIWTDRDMDPAATSIAGFPIGGLMAEADVRELPVGTPICLDGAISGLVCADLVNGDDHRRIRFAAAAVEGDSGAPVFVVERERRQTTVIGILEGGNGLTSTATYIDAALQRLGARLVTDAG
ncbi:hypothetical protein [Mycolicibacterium poriferae]|uniref:hypothetical protein n=1 Tax=Mycolicibacterium poriferae TaxID=39694 RepID=UPI0024BA6C54|nr:hypothetical protein [Mycolicibacterium poriferae]